MMKLRRSPPGHHRPAAATVKRERLYDGMRKAGSPAQRRDFDCKVRRFDERLADRRSKLSAFSLRLASVLNRSAVR
jgi:hypothetical protein